MEAFVEDPMDFFGSFCAGAATAATATATATAEKRRLAAVKKNSQGIEHELREIADTQVKDRAFVGAAAVAAPVQMMGDGEVLSRYVHENEDPSAAANEPAAAIQEKASSSPKRNYTVVAHHSSDQADSKEACKDAGSWSAQATAVLLDVFREKRLAINGRNFRGEEWEELALGVNERCHFGNSNSNSSSKDQWKNAKQCSYKMSNLKRKYKSEKEMLQLSGGNAASGWQWFSRMEAIFASDPKYAALGGVGNGGDLHAKLEMVPAVGDLFDNNDDEIVNNNNNNNNNNHLVEPISASLPASKSASTNNLDGCSPSPRHDMGAESSPRSMCEVPASLNGKQAKKKQCLGSSMASPVGDVVPGSFADSMKLMLMQQKETIHLLRELVSWKSQQRHDQDNSDIGGRRDLVDLKLKIESAERDLMHAKQLCEIKEKELKDAMLSYEEKNKIKSDLVRKLMEAIYEKERLKMKRLVSIDRNAEAMQQRHHDNMM